MEKNTIEHRVTMKIEAEAYAEMIAYAHKFSPDECSGIGLVERIDYDDNSIEFNVTKIFVPNQYNTAGTTDIPDEELNRTNTELVIAGEDTEKLKFHWHSHVDMTVFHSGTDDENYDDLKVGSFAVSLVVNKRGDMLGSVHLYEPMRISICNIEVEVPGKDDVQVDEDKIQSTYDRVKKHEPALLKEHGRAPIGGIYDKDYAWYDDAILEGLAHDVDFESLLVQGEKAGMITLFYDNFYNIYGYQNNRTLDCYTIGTEVQTWDKGTKFKEAKTSDDAEKGGYLYD